MHLSDTLVIGPLPLRARPVRVPLGAALTIGAALLVVASGAAVGAPRLVTTALAPLAARLAVTFPALAPAATAAAIAEGTEVRSAQELSVLGRRCLDRRIPDRATLVTEVTAWTHHRNVEQTT